MCLFIAWEHNYTVKKVNDFPIPSQDVTNQTLPGPEYLNYSRPGRVWLVTSRQGTGKWQTFFYNVHLILYLFQGSCPTGTRRAPSTPSRRSTDSTWEQSGSRSSSRSHVTRQSPTKSNLKIHQYTTLCMGQLMKVGKGGIKDYTTDGGPRRVTFTLRSLCIKWKDGGREWTGRFVSKPHAESRGEGGGGRVSWGLKEAGTNSISRNFSYTVELWGSRGESTEAKPSMVCTVMGGPCCLLWRTVPPDLARGLLSCDPNCCCCC